MKNKAIKKAFTLGMSALLFAATGVPTTVQAAGWKQNTTGWWWQEDDGSYPVSRWQLIGGNYYYFDQNGYMKTGWMKLARRRSDASYLEHGRMFRERHSC